MAELHFTAAPQSGYDFQVGDRVRVYCDHDDDEGNRVRGWLVGVVVQVDIKMVAVQFQRNVYLTDGWMVPDRVLWCPKDSPNLRPHTRAQRKKRRSSLTEIP